MTPAICLIPFCLDINKDYVKGDIFVPPSDYPESRTVDLWLMGWITEPPAELLSEDMREKLSWPEWVEMRRNQLLCPECNKP